MFIRIFLGFFVGVDDVTGVAMVTVRHYSPFRLVIMLFSNNYDLGGVCLSCGTCRSCYGLGVYNHGLGDVAVVWVRG